MESSHSNPEIMSREHYTYVTRSLIRLFSDGALTNVNTIIVEPDYGYVTRITYIDNSHRLTYGNDLGLNVGSSSEIAKDKGHTKFVLKAIGVNYPSGEEFLLPWWTREIEQSQKQRGNETMKTTDMAEGYIEQNLGYPVYVKPVAGSRGSGVQRVHNTEELAEVFEIYDEKKVRVAIVEETINMPDYRVLVLDGKLISAYQRIPLTVIGDGELDIGGLILKLQEQYFAEGRNTNVDPNDSRILRYLGKQGLSLKDKPVIYEAVTLADISNLSAGGKSEDVTDIINTRWINLATYVAKNFNLRLCGVDLACTDITDSESEYSVLEVNATPGLDHYASSGESQKKAVDDLYIKVFNAMPAI